MNAILGSLPMPTRRGRGRINVPGRDIVFGLSWDLNSFGIVFRLEAHHVTGGRRVEPVKGAIVVSRVVAQALVGKFYVLVTKLETAGK